MGVAHENSEICFECSSVPNLTDFGFEVGNESIGQDFVSFRIGEDRVEEVGLSNLLRVEEVLFVKKTFDTVGKSKSKGQFRKMSNRSNDSLPQVNDIVELGDSTVPNFWSSETSLSLNLRREMTEKNDSRLIRSKKERSNE